MKGWSPSPGTLKTAARWVALAFGLVTLFVLVLFPYDLLQARLLALAGAATGTDLRAEGWAWAWPVGVRWTRVTAGSPAAYEAASLEVRPSGSALIQGKPGVHLALSLRTDQNPSAGRVEFLLRLDGWSAQAPARVTGMLDRLDLQVYAPALGQLGLPTALRAGRLSLMFDHAWASAGDGGQFIVGEGAWEVLLSDLSLDRLVLGPFTASPEEISVVKARFNCRAGACDVQDFRGESPDGIATGSGRLTPRLPFRDSIVNLTIDLLPSLSMAQKANNPMVRAGTPIRLTVSGRLSDLSVSL